MIFRFKKKQKMCNGGGGVMVCVFFWHYYPRRFLNFLQLYLDRPGTRVVWIKLKYFFFFVTDDTCLTETLTSLRWLLLLRPTGLLLLPRLLLWRPLPTTLWRPPTPAPSTSRWLVKSVWWNPASTNSGCATPAMLDSMTVPTSTVTSTTPRWPSRVMRVIPTSAAALLNWNWNLMMMIIDYDEKKQKTRWWMVLCFFYCPVCVYLRDTNKNWNAFPTLLWLVASCSVFRYNVSFVSWCL